MVIVPVYFQDAKKSRLPVPIKPSWSSGSMSQLPDTQALVAQLQGQILELQAELKEFKIRNKQLHHQLILAEAMMEGRPAADQTPPNGKQLRNKLYTHQPVGSIATACCVSQGLGGFAGLIFTCD